MAILVVMDHPLLKSRVWHGRILPLVRKWQADLSYRNWEAVKKDVHGYADSDYEPDYFVDDQGRLCNKYNGGRRNNFDMTTYMHTSLDWPSIIDDISSLRGPVIGPCRHAPAK